MRSKSWGSESMYPYDLCISKAEFDLKNNLRLLWEQHGTWTRSAIVSLVFALSDTKFVLARLLQNATDMGNMLNRITEKK
jgi:hypothetical protein